MTAQALCDAIRAGTVELTSGVEAQLTREAFILPYVEQMNYEKYIPILTFNKISTDLTINSGVDNKFTSTDLFIFTDWICLNAKA